MKHKKNRPDAPSKVFRFICRKPVDNASQLDQCFFNYNTLYNDAIAKLRQWKEEYFAFLRQLDPQIGEVNSAVDDAYKTRREIEDKAGLKRVKNRTKKISDPELQKQWSLIETDIKQLKKKRSSLIDVCWHRAIHARLRRTGVATA